MGFGGGGDVSVVRESAIVFGIVGLLWRNQHGIGVKVRGS